MASLLGAAGAFKGAASGLGKFANLKLKQEQEQAQFLRDQNMARFRSNLAEEANIRAEGRADTRAIAAEGRAAETRESFLGSGFVSPEGKELTKREFGKLGIAPDELKERGFLSITEFEELKENKAFDTKLKRLKQIKKFDTEEKINTLKDTLAFIHTGSTPEEINTMARLVMRKELYGDKEVTAENRIKILTKAQESLEAKGIDLESPNYQKRLENEIKVFSDLTKGKSTASLIDSQAGLSETQAAKESVARIEERVFGVPLEQLEAEAKRMRKGASKDEKIAINAMVARRKKAEKVKAGGSVTSVLGTPSRRIPVKETPEQLLERAKAAKAKPSFLSRMVEDQRKRLDKRGRR